MRPVVALLSARPETIADDYRRLFHLAGLDSLASLDDLVLAVEARRIKWGPGKVCPPWQLQAVLKSLAATHLEEFHRPLLVPVSDDGPVSAFNIRAAIWNDLLEEYGIQPLAAEEMAAAPFRPGALLPALEGTLAQGFRISPHLRGKNLLLMSTMGLGFKGALNANLDLLDSLLVAKKKIVGKIPLSEVKAEIVGLARDVFSSLWVVTDATVWSVVRRGGRTVYLPRNLLIAGNDPVAVDSILSHLAGLKPGDSPWLALCQDRGLGVSDPAKMKIVGEPEWLDLDFQVPEDTFTSSGNPVEKLFPRGVRKKLAGFGDGSRTHPEDSPWEMLFHDYQSGETS